MFQNGIQGDVDALVLIASKASALDRHDRETHLGAHVLAHGHDVIPHDLGAAGRDHEHDRRVEHLRFEDRPCQHLLPAVDDLVLAQLGAQGQGFGVIGVLPSKGGVHELKTALWRVRQHTAASDPQSGLSRAVEGAAQIGVVAARLDSLAC